MIGRGNAIAGCGDNTIHTVSRNDSADTGQTFVYFGWLTLFVYLATPGGYLVDIQTSYMLKNQLHATATQVSLFRLVTGIPVYFAFVFGLMRDLWNPLGLRDRGFFLIFAPATAIAFVGMAMSRLSYQGLLTGMLLVMLASRFIAAAYQGLIALIGQEKLMSGRLSTLWNVVSSVPVIMGAFASGYISEHVPPKATFSLVAVLTLFIALLGLWKPYSVFRNTYDRPQARGLDFLGDVKRLLRHRAIYPAVLICSYYNGIFAVSFIPTFLLYGVLCKKVPLNKLLWWGTIIAVPQMIPLAFIHSGNLALLLAAPIGLMGGIATAAYFDLAIRSCPAGLQGTLMMLVEGVFALSARGGDLLGSSIYNSSPSHGFLYCVIATTIVYMLILPLILLVPKDLISTADGESSRAIGAEGPNEIATMGPS
jgi:MFS family permease